MYPIITSRASARELLNSLKKPILKMMKLDPLEVFTNIIKKESEYELTDFVKTYSCEFLTYHDPTHLLQGLVGIIHTHPPACARDYHLSNKDKNFVRSLANQQRALGLEIHAIIIAGNNEGAHMLAIIKGIGEIEEEVTW